MSGSNRRTSTSKDPFERVRGSREQRDESEPDTPRDNISEGSEEAQGASLLEAKRANEKAALEAKIREARKNAEVERAKIREARLASSGQGSTTTSSGQLPQIGQATAQQTTTTENKGTVSGARTQATNTLNVEEAKQRQREIQEKKLKALKEEEEKRRQAAENKLSDLQKQKLARIKAGERGTPLRQFDPAKDPLLQGRTTGKLPEIKRK